MAVPKKKPVRAKRASEQHGGYTDLRRVSILMFIKITGRITKLLMVIVSSEPKN